MGHYTVHRQFRKLIKTKGGFPNANSLLKLLYVGRLNAVGRLNVVGILNATDKVTDKWTI